MVLLAGCGLLGPPPVEVSPAEPSGRAAAACEALVDALPSKVLDQESRAVDPTTALAAAWGDPAIVLRCGVAEPAALRASSPCVEVNGVGWFAEQAQNGYLFTTVGREAYVEVGVPSAYAPESSALVDLASAVRRHVPERAPCL